MKKIVCEICGDSDLLKIDNYYVCQSCGSKYTVEEARKMLVEIEGTVNVQGTVKIDNSSSEKIYIQDFKNNIKVRNIKGALEAAKKLQEIGSTSAFAQTPFLITNASESTICLGVLDDLITEYEKLIANCSLEEKEYIQKTFIYSTTQLINGGCNYFAKCSSIVDNDIYGKNAMGNYYGTVSSMAAYFKYVSLKFDNEIISDMTTLYHSYVHSVLDSIEKKYQGLTELVNKFLNTLSSKYADLYVFNALFVLGIVVRFLNPSSMREEVYSFDTGNNSIIHIIEELYDKSASDKLLKVFGLITTSVEKVINTIPTQYLAGTSIPYNWLSETCDEDIKPLIYNLYPKYIMYFEN